MRLTVRLVLGTFAVTACAVTIMVWGAREAVPGVVIITLGVALALAWVAGRSIARPLVSLANAARDIAAGATPRFPRSHIPEIDTLITSLRRMHREIADRVVELQQERAGGDAIVAAMIEGVLAADNRGRIVAANPAARRMLGYARDAAIPDLPSLFRDRAAREAVSQLMAGDAVYNSEVDLDGKTVAINGRPLHGNGAVLVLHDLTELRRLEAVRRDFVANVSHELKTPLTSISGYADTLLDPAIDPETREHFVATIRANAQRMQRLVDDLLDLSRIEAGRWVPRPQDLLLRAVIDDAWQPLADRARFKRVHFEIHIAGGAEHLLADGDAIRQVLTNLLDNALRYVPAGGHIGCRVEQEDHGIAISVHDDGAGIPAEHLGRIFERFYRVDAARSREEGGTGLGLAIVRHLVEAHGGRVSATSELNRGTTIRCWFPAVPAKAIAA
ncbi:MAG TPA: ATP-binding protein [Gemmatimonadales bacterium]|jgi:two-component system phosphate regulon sensor histidine kinase PhoR